MVCSNWNSDNSFCSFKGTTINYEDLSLCAGNCAGYAKAKKPDTQVCVCKSCGNEFTAKWTRKVEIKGKEYDKCPKCGSTSVRRDDEDLS